LSNKKSKKLVKKKNKKKLSSKKQIKKNTFFTFSACNKQKNTVCLNHEK